MLAAAVAAEAEERRQSLRQAHEWQNKYLWLAASPNSLLATCAAATGGGERGSDAGKDEDKRAAGDYEDTNEGERDGASVDALP
jgi:hypothetical protein